MGGEKGLAANAHKLAYGHFLGGSGNDIRSCVSHDILRRDHPDFYQRLVEYKTALAEKRR